MGIPLRELEGLQQKVRGTAVLSLEERLPSDRGSDIPLMDTLAGDEGHLGADVEQHEVRQALVAAVESLSKQERTVISLYYFEGRTLKEIKAVLGVSESRVSQIHAQAVIHLRQKLRVLRSDLGFRENDPTIKQKYVRRPRLARSRKSRLIVRLRGAAPNSPLFSALMIAVGLAAAANGSSRATATSFSCGLGWRALAPTRCWRRFATTTTWTQERRKMYDRFVDVPREQAWFGDDRERPFTPELLAVRRDSKPVRGALRLRPAQPVSRRA